MPSTNGHHRPKDFLGKSQAAGYRPSVVSTGMWMWGEEFIPYLAWFELERMLLDHQIQFGLGILAAPIHTVKWKITAPPEVAKFIDSTLTTIWKHDLGKILEAFVYGSAGGEVIYRKEQGKVVFDSLLDIHPNDIKPLVYKKNKKFAGVAISNVPGKPAFRLPSPRCWWVAFNARYGSYWGRSRLRSAWQVWKERRGDKGAIKARQMWFTKNAYDGGLMRHPEGNFTDEFGVSRPAQEIARQIMELKETGGVLILPNSKNPETGEFEWIYEPAKVNGELHDVREYVKDLDMETLRAVGIPPEIVQAQESGSGGYAGRTIPALHFFASEDAVVDTVIECVDRQIVSPLVSVNFGKVRYKIEVESLIPKTQEQGQGQGMGGGAANLLGGIADQQGGMPDDQQQEQPPDDGSGLGDLSSLGLSLESDRSERENVSPVVDAIINRGVSAGLTVSEEVRRKVRSLLKKNYRVSKSCKPSGAF